MVYRGRADWVLLFRFLFSQLDKDAMKAQRQAKQKEEDDFLEYCRQNPPDHSQANQPKRKGRKKWAITTFLVI